MANAGELILVYWAADKKFYEGKVTRFDAATNTHRVEYVDGDIENLDLNAERWRRVGDSEDVKTGDNDVDGAAVAGKGRRKARTKRSGDGDAGGQAVQTDGARTCTTNTISAVKGESVCDEKLLVEMSGTTVIAKAEPPMTPVGDTLQTPVSSIVAPPVSNTTVLPTSPPNAKAPMDVERASMGEQGGKPVEAPPKADTLMARKRKRVSTKAPRKTSTPTTTANGEPNEGGENTAPVTVSAKRARIPAPEVKSEVTSVGVMAKLATEATRRALEGTKRQLEEKLGGQQGDVASSIEEFTRKQDAIVADCAHNKRTIEALKSSVAPAAKLETSLYALIEKYFGERERQQQAEHEALVRRIRALEVELRNGAAPGNAASLRDTLMAEVRNLRSDLSGEIGKLAKSVDARVKGAADAAATAYVQGPLPPGFKHAVQNQAARAAADTVRNVITKDLPNAIEKALLPRIAALLQNPPPKSLASTVVATATVEPTAGAAVSTDVRGRGKEKFAGPKPFAIPRSPRSRSAPGGGGVVASSSRNATSLPSSPVKRSIDRITAARALVGRAATVWLLEDTERCPPPARAALRTAWTRECCTQCFRYIAKKLRQYRDDGEAVRVLDALSSLEHVELTWFINPEATDAIQRARANYRAWDPPLTNDEWRAEASVLAELARRFSVVANRPNKSLSSLTALQLAISLTTHAVAADV